jgi:hypothetical protein
MLLIQRSGIKLFNGLRTRKKKENLTHSPKNMFKNKSTMSKKLNRFLRQLFRSTKIIKMRTIARVGYALRQKKVMNLKECQKRGSLESNSWSQISLSIGVRVYTTGNKKLETP